MSVFPDFARLAGWGDRRLKTQNHPPNPRRGGLNPPITTPIDTYPKPALHHPAIAGSMKNEQLTLGMGRVYLIDDGCPKSGLPSSPSPFSHGRRGAR
ncbi:hypothetical protein [Roseofilum capinflatum]|uniref:Uncharacterized protein n=1 Tax=Roseofilum capinflatum BLCC-M114 TaxID=3022440 RepID=A0ABT7B755_9CYAN|nr:hypothetical protein [Roseofilum capinflatum]MDJ1175004.1 hypothetical protein [Roseofilum capinflatum BLCC-M114]